jgi:glycosyltransferase involved in cell wall biosynthesis
VFGPTNSDPNQQFLYTDNYPFDILFGTAGGKELYTKHFRSFLEAYRPDVVHFQHTMFLGYDMIREVQNTLPHAAIIYTLHEYMPICHRQGQMVRTVNDEELCTHESPRRCHECFPGVSPQAFFMRKRFVQSHFNGVDCFLAPSYFLRQRYIAWGLPGEKIRFEEYGRRDCAVPPSNTEERQHTRLGYFGQLTHFKGVHVLLSAMKQLAQEYRLPTHELRVQGANLDIQPGQFQNEIRELLDETRDHVRLVGRYTHDQLPGIMEHVDWVIVPSIWWENSPLVIQEAFLHGKPVICSNIGGMAEKVSHNVNGLHFRVGDSSDLCRTIHSALTTAGLWERLRSGIPQVYSIAASAAKLSLLYEELIERKRERLPRDTVLANSN